MQSNLTEFGETYAEQPISSAFHFFLTGKVKDDLNTQSLVRKLKSCSVQDEVHIHINTPGGDLFTTMQIINSITACAGNVATYADGQVASAGSLIFFTGDMMTVADLTSFLIHNGFGGAVGKMSDVHMQSDHLKALYYKIFHSVYEPFFTPEEIDKVLGGSDIYLDTDQVIGRISRVFEEQQKDNNNNENNDEQRHGPFPTPGVGKKKRRKS